MSDTIIDKIKSFKFIFESSIRYETWGLFILYGIHISLFLLLRKIVITNNFNIYLFVTLPLIIICWFYERNHYPRNIKNKIGLVFSIETENDKQRIRINNDFVYKINKNIKEHGLSLLFNIIVLDDYKSNKLNRVINDYSVINRKIINKDIKKLKEVQLWERYHSKLNSHLIIYGRIIERKDIQNTYCLEFEALANHIPVDIRISDALSKEMLLAFIKEAKFHEVNELKGFGITADAIFIAALYISGLAAYISGDPYTAYELHKSIENDLKRLQLPNFKQISDKIKAVQSDETFWMAKNELNLGHKPKAKELFEQTIILNPKHYSALINLSVIYFVDERNPVKCLRYLKRAEKNVGIDLVWLYNRAFLFMYVGKYKKGFRDYRKLETLSFNNENLTVDECINFNKQVLKDEPTKIQCLFVLGFLYGKKKKNIEEGKKYFEEFKTKASNRNEYIELITRVDTYINELKKQIQ